MLVEFILAFAIIVLSILGLAVGVLLGRGALRGTCATVTIAEDGACPVCGRENTAGGAR